jgi:hypothetical protein
LSDGSRKLVTRGGFLSPSLDGGLPLLELFNPSRRSSSAIRAFRAAISAALRPDQRNQFFPRWLAWRLRIHESLNRNKIPLSRKNFRFDREKLAALPGQ